MLRLHDETGGDPGQRAEATKNYAFSVPTNEVLDLIAAVSPDGIVEIGAGTGYWAALLTARGADVVAYDIAPAPSVDNEFFSGIEPWFAVRKGNESAVSDHLDRTLLLVWPTWNENWPGDTLVRFHEGGGACVVFVGEPPGGRTGDDRFHALAGNLERCSPCSLGVLASACICGIEPLWRLSREAQLPGWGADLDLVQVLERVDPPISDRADPRAPGMGRRASDALRGLGLFGQVWTIGVVAFCIARAVVVWPLLRRYGVNPWWFLAIDIGTAPLYGVGQAMGVKLIRDDTRPLRDAVPWIVALLGAFVAPYAYLLGSAGQLPSYVIVGVVAWIVVFGAFAVVRLLREGRRPDP